MAPQVVVPGYPVTCPQRRINVKKLLAISLGTLLLAGLAVLAPAGYGATQAPSSADKTTPSYDMKAQAALDLQDLQKKIVGLAEAIPADKYTWRPETGTRSVSELFLHIAAANYNIPTMMTGVTPAPGFEGKGFEKSTADKAKVIEQLNKSFAYAIAAVNNMSNADFAKPEKKLGPDANDGDVVYLMVVHMHEHRTVHCLRANEQHHAAADGRSGKEESKGRRGIRPNSCKLGQEVHESFGFSVFNVRPM
jgi:uncharacterized damage-inducible protein DinB